MPSGDHGFIPPWQDLATLAKHLCLSEHSIEEYVRLGLLPMPRKIKGKRLWQWSKVESYLEAQPNAGAHSEDEDTRRIAEATRAALNERH